MNMKKLFSLALLVSAFSVVPAFAVEGDDVKPEAPKTEVKPEVKPEAPQEVPQEAPQEVPQVAPQVDGPTWYSWDRVSTLPVIDELTGVWHPITSGQNYITFLRGLVTNNPVKTFATFAIIMGIYNNVDNIKSALGLAEEQEEADAQVFADAKCGCTDEQAEEEAAVEVCVLEEEETKKANA